MPIFLKFHLKKHSIWILCSVNYSRSSGKPLKMQEIADSLGIDVSTVSRAIADKYAQTHRGIFPIKFFFTGAIDEVGIFDMALTEDDIRTIKAEGLSKALAICPRGTLATTWGQAKNRE